ncbi:hypothetical protein ACFYOV_12705 [Streptomyces sp. NPDC005931]|uniref:hypothetical protein n=1 Tax=Streptomyces sp. NPDC005931 TaxID=3364737 RepID=UPI003690C496
MPGAVPVSGEETASPDRPVSPVAPAIEVSGVTEDVARAVGERVVSPVHDLVGAVAEARQDVPPLSSLPWPPDVPGVHQPAPLPELPQLPGVPSPTLPPPAGPEPWPGATLPPSTDLPSPSDGRRGGQDGAAVHGPAHAITGTLALAGAHDADGPHPAPQDAAAPAGPAPAPHVPGGPHDGSVGNRSAADTGGSRHGDAQAVTADHRAPLRLLPGAVVRAEATQARDGYRDVPVSPA